MSNKDIANYLQSGDIFVNTSRMGSLDKAILEAMVLELPILTCNEALASVLGEYAAELMFDKGDATGLARKVERLMNMPFEHRVALGRALGDLVAKDHALPSFVAKIFMEFKMLANE